MSQLLQEIEALRQPMKELNDFIFDHPELGNEEFQAHELLTNLLEKEGFTVDREVSGLKTAFRAVYHVNGGGPKIGLLCEYDALEARPCVWSQFTRSIHLYSGDCSETYVASTLYTSCVRYACRGDGERQARYGSRRRV